MKINALLTSAGIRGGQKSQRLKIEIKKTETKSEETTSGG
jgi:hypothetical protein